MQLQRPFAPLEMPVLSAPVQKYKAMYAQDSLPGRVVSDARSLNCWQGVTMSQVLEHLMLRQAASHGSHLLSVVQAS